MSDEPKGLRRLVSFVRAAIRRREKLPLSHVAQSISSFVTNDWPSEWSRGLDPLVFARETLFLNAHTQIHAIFTQVKEQEHIDYFAAVVARTVFEKRPDLDASSLSARLEQYRMAEARVRDGDYLAIADVFCDGIGGSEGHPKDLPLSMGVAIAHGHAALAALRFYRTVQEEFRLVR